MLLGHLKSSVSSFNLTHPRWSYTTLNTYIEPRGARMTELVLRVFQLWGRYCLHLTFSACLRTHGPRYRIRTGPICLEGRDASRWHQSRIGDLRFLSHLCINIIPRFSRKIKFSHTQTHKLELWFEVAAQKAHYRKMWPRANWCLKVDSNRRQTGYEPVPLPTEVPRHKTNFSFLLLLVAEVCIFYEGWPLHRVRRHLHQ